MTEDLRTGWDEYLRFARRFVEMPGFEDEETDYKLLAVAPLQEAMKLPAGAEWSQAVKRGFSNPHANIVSFWSFSPFIRWMESDVQAAHQALELLWGDGPEDAPARIDAFDEVFPREVLPGDGVRCNVVAYLLGAKAPYDWPNYRAMATRLAFELARHPLMPDGARLGERYGHALSFFDATIAEAAARGFHLRHRLDAQSVMWGVAAWQDKPADFTADEWAELLEFRAVPSQLRRHRAAGSSRPKVVRRPSRPVCPICGHDERVVLVGPSGERWIWVCESGPQHPEADEEFEFESS